MDTLNYDLFGYTRQPKALVFSGPWVWDRGGYGQSLMDARRHCVLSDDSYDSGVAGSPEVEAIVVAAPDMYALCFALSQVPSSPASLNSLIADAQTVLLRISNEVETSNTYQNRQKDRR